jgi:putative transcriptional regulator
MPKKVRSVKVKKAIKPRKISKGPTMLGKTILEVIHEMAKDLHKIGGIDAVTMREYDALCLPPIKEFTPNEIKKLRLREKVSQPIFAKFLNISPSMVKQWEQGTKQPRGGLLKLLNLVADNGLNILGSPKIAA